MTQSWLGSDRIGRRSAEERLELSIELTLILISDEKRRLSTAEFFFGNKPLRLFEPQNFLKLLRRDSGEGFEVAMERCRRHAGQFA